MFSVGSTLLTKLFRRTVNIRRFGDDMLQENKAAKALALGIYYDEETDEHELTPSGIEFNVNSGGQLEHLIKEKAPILKGESHIFNSVHEDFMYIAVSGLGSKDVGYNALENLDEVRENCRVAAGAAAKALGEVELEAILFDPMGCSDATAEAVALSMYKYEEFRANKSCPMATCMFGKEDPDAWERGTLSGEAQNIARMLCEIPSNYCTPLGFAQRIQDVLCDCEIKIEIHDKDWMETNKFVGSLAVARASSEPPVVIELKYCGTSPDCKPIVFVGKGTTFNTGGLFLKKTGMAEYRADMSGAASIVGMMSAVSSFSLPINVTCLLICCENCIGGMSIKPGDILTMANGKTIQIDSPAHDGHLMVADGVCYAQLKYAPNFLIDVATLTAGSRAALGCSSSQCFTNSDQLYKLLSGAGALTGDRVWRFPLWKHFSGEVTELRAADVSNVGNEMSSSCCQGAAFIREFISCMDWMHLDITSCGMLAHWQDYPYLREGMMTGRPTRTLIQFLYQLACKISGPSSKPCPACVTQSELMKEEEEAEGEKGKNSASGAKVRGNPNTHVNNPFAKGEEQEMSPQNKQKQQAKEMEGRKPENCAPEPRKK